MSTVEVVAYRTTVKPKSEYRKTRKTDVS